jgi:hypothetical protein
MWDYTGMKVFGEYMNEFPVTGRVESSRVAYGGDVKHTVVLDDPITVYGSVRDRVILEHKQIVQVRD